MKPQLFGHTVFIFSERRPITIETKSRTIITYLILTVLLILGIIFNQEFFHNVASHLTDTAVPAFIAACIFGLLYRILDGVFLYMTGKNHSGTLTLRRCISIAFAGAFFRVTTLGSGMAISKIYYMTREDVPAGDGMGICLVQYIFIRLATLFWGLLGLLLCKPVRLALAPYCKLTAAGIAACILINIFLIIAALCQEPAARLFFYFNRLFLKHEKMLSYIKKGEDQISLLQKEAHMITENHRLCLRLSGLSLLAQALWYLIPCVITYAHDIPVLPVFAAMAVTCLLAGVIPTPSGFGSVEILFTVMFTGLGSPALAASAALIYRFSSTFAPFFAGIIPVFLYKSGKYSSSGQP